jgi:hypothetical protein
LTRGDRRDRKGTEKSHKQRRRTGDGERKGRVLWIRI